jgi:hypothetical protein
VAHAKDAYLKLYPILKKNFANRRRLLLPVKGLKIIVIFRCTFREAELAAEQGAAGYRPCVDARALSTTDLVGLAPGTACDCRPTGVSGVGVLGPLPKARRALLMKGIIGQIADCAGAYFLNCSSNRTQPHSGKIASFTLVFIERP